MKDKIHIYLKLYVITILILAFFCIFLSVYMTEWNRSMFYDLLLFCFLITSSNMSPIKLPKVGSVTITFAIHIAAIANFGSFVPIFSEIFSTIFLIILRDKSERFKEIFNGSQFIICIFLGSLVSKPWTDSEITINLIQAKSVFFISIIYFIINTLLVTLVISLDQKIKPWNVWITNFKLLTPHYLALAPLGFLIAVIYYYMGSLGLALFFLPLLLARHTFKLYMEMRAAYLNTIETLINSIEAKDKYTRGHSERVANISVKIGKQLGMDDIDLEQLNYLALLHDIGKIAVRDSILNKVGKLNDEEFDIIKSHPETGAEIVKNIKLLKDDQGIILHHHEWWDGTGYPNRLKGDEIPLQARIITVADSYDAMTSDRAYRKALAYETALNEIIKCSGKQFDPKVVQAFIEIVPELYPEVDIKSIKRKVKICNNTKYAF